MRKIIISCLGFYIGVGSISAQETPGAPGFGNVVVSVAIPELPDFVSANDRVKIESKLIRMVTAVGVSGVGHEANFVLYPQVALEDVSVVEGGMRAINVATVDVSLFIKQVDQNLLFASYNVRLKGSGRNRRAAIGNAFTRLSPRDPEFRQFIRTGTRRIVEHFESNCPAIQAEGRRLTQAGDYEAALAWLSHVPTEAGSCYTKIAGDVREVMTAYDRATCRAQIQQARTALASGDYDLVLDRVEAIDAVSECAEEVPEIIAEADRRISERESERREVEMEQYRERMETQRERIRAEREMYATRAALEQRRLEIAREWVKEYYSRLPQRRYRPGLFR